MKPATVLPPCALLTGLLAAGVMFPVGAQQPPAPAPTPAAAAGTAAPAAPAPAAPPAAAVPPGYVIGPNDLLSVVFWREKEMSADVVVRPDGRISLPLINEVEAVGLTPEELRTRIGEMAAQYIQEPNVSVVVKQINSRLVYITGNIGKPGPYPLMQPTTVMQLIAMSGGLSEWADGEGIVIMRTENGKPVRYKFNYKWVLQGLNMRQNIELKPGDTVLVP
jgi:polysaccharide export outer membrane protein